MASLVFSGGGGVEGCGCGPTFLSGGGIFFSPVTLKSIPILNERSSWKGSEKTIKLWYYKKAFYVISKV